VAWCGAVWRVSLPLDGMMSGMYHYVVATYCGYAMNRPVDSNSSGFLAESSVHAFVIIVSLNTLGCAAVVKFGVLFTLFAIAVVGIVGGIAAFLLFAFVGYMLDEVWGICEIELEENTKILIFLLGAVISVVVFLNLIY